MRSQSGRANTYGADRSKEYRNYICRGKLKNAHIDGSPKCTNRNIRADLLEQVVWIRVMDIINDPNKLELMLIEAIDKLKERESALETRLLPMERRLKEIAEMKSRLVEKWVIDNMNTEKYRIAQQNLDKEEARLIALRRETDPNEMAELESTRSLLKLWQRQVNSLAWNQEDPTTEDRVMVRSVDKPHEMILKMIGLGYNELSEEMQFPLTQRELFDKLQLRLIVFKDKIEVKAVFPIPDIAHQECTSTLQSTCHCGVRPSHILVKSTSGGRED